MPISSPRLAKNLTSLAYLLDANQLSIHHPSHPLSLSLSGQMDEHYDFEAARTALAAIIVDRKAHDATHSQLAEIDLTSVHVQSLQHPKCWKLVDNNQDETSIAQCVVRLQGIVHSKMLPPLPNPTSMHAMQRARPHIRQAVTITGLGLPAFDEFIEKIENVYMAFYDVFPNNTMEGWHPGQADGFPAITAQTRYFERVHAHGTAVPSVGFTNYEDPNGVLAAMEADGFVHGEDNSVEYRARYIDTTRNTATYKHINPVTIKEGDIVEVSITFAVYPTKDRKHVFVPHIKGILLLSQEQREKAAILRMRSRFKPEVPPPTMKRKNLYPDEEIVEEARAKVSKLSLDDTTHSMQLE
ncbi:hypothetical protein CPC08DRAFT_769067 [Agrocybe pediades]|nr:hypothetical protein CPC08DRAFT_769067 [Agrocybe pediades]